MKYGKPSTHKLGQI